MSNPEIKVGQKYRVVDAKGFGYSDGRAEAGDTLEVTERLSVFSNHYVKNLTRDAIHEILIYPEDVAEGHLELIDEVQGPTEASGAVTEVPATNIPEEAENVSQTSTGGSTGMFEAANTCVGTTRSSEDTSEGITIYRNGEPMSRPSSMSGELLWKFIAGSSTHNGHFQMELGELSIEALKDSVIGLGDYLEQDRDTLASSLEIRLMYNGDFGGKYSGTWSASVYQLDYWGLEEHHLGHTDRLLFSVEIVRGI